MKERTKEMLNLRKQYWTLKMIGRKYGISRQRVAQIIGRTGKISEMIERKQGGSKKSIARAKANSNTPNENAPIR